MQIKKAILEDAKHIYALINKSAENGDMLPRALNEIYENIRDFFVCKNKGKIIGTVALHIMWENLAEIRSIAVAKEYRNSGIGKKLAEQCLKEARQLGVKKVFALTYNLTFFRSLGFKNIDKNKLPQKIWSDCVKCPKFPECEESAVIKSLS